MRTPKLVDGVLTSLLLSVYITCGKLETMNLQRKKTKHFFFSFSFVFFVLAPALFLGTCKRFSSF